jgi:tRNA(Ile)-lysidine synthase TilS/MesJ
MASDETICDRLAGFLTKKVNRAVYEFGMIEDGDRVAVALSGGKDSFSLLEGLRYRQRFVPERYSVVAVHVVGDARGPEMPPYPQLEDWLRANGHEYLIRQSFIPADEALPMSCERCTWNRRRTLFEMAKELGCNRVALGHHLDDMAQTALLNLIFQGRNETMEPMRDYFDGELKLIRPLMYVPEGELKRFAAVHEFPAPPPPCPRGEHTQRARMRELLREMQRECRSVKKNLVRSALGQTRQD